MAAQPYSQADDTSGRGQELCLQSWNPMAPGVAPDEPSPNNRAGGHLAGGKLTAPTLTAGASAQLDIIGVKSVLP